VNVAAVPVALARPEAPAVLPAKVLTVPYTVAGTAPPEFVGAIENGTPTKSALVLGV
jgi:hypothetical protein